MSADTPWHEPGRWYSPPAYWEDEVQDAIAADDRQVAILDCTLSEGEDMLGRHLGWTAWIELTELLDELGVGVITDPMGPGPDELGDYLRAVRARGVSAHIEHKIISVTFPEADDGWREETERFLELPYDSYQFMGTYPKRDAWADFERDDGISFGEIAASLERTLGFMLDARAERGVEDRDLVYGVRYAFDHRVDTLVDIAGAAVDAGADGVYLFDSTGQGNPPASRLVCQRIKARIGDADLYVQHHNDLGLATAAIMGAAEGGADYLDASVCGVGERGGTAALEEVALALESYGWDTGIDLAKLNEVAEYVQDAMGFRVHQHKPVVGAQIDKEEGIGHQYPGDPPESPAGVATGPVLGRPFEGVVGYNVLKKYRRSASRQDREDLVWSALAEWGYDDVSPEAAARLDERIADELMGRGWFGLERLRTIAEATLERE